MQTSLRKLPISFIVLLILFSANNLFAKELKILNTPPPGFEKNVEETLFVDIYYKNKFLLTQKAIIKDDKIKLLNPMVVYNQLPQIKDDRRQEVLAHLSGYNDFKTIYSCFPERKENCDMLNPGSLELVYNPDILTLEIFTNSNIFVVDENNDIYLDPQSKDFSQFFKFDAVGYWSRDKNNLESNYIANPLYYYTKNQDLYNVNINSKTSFQRFTLNGDIRYIDDSKNVFVDDIYLIRYFKRNLLQIGEITTKDLRNLNQANILGVSFRSSINRRKKNSGLYSQPLNVFLNYRSRVNLIKDGRIYSSEFYDAGSQNLNTDSLPTGSYNIDIQIIEPNGQIRMERQFFVKNGELPPADQAYYWFEGGAIENYENVGVYNFDSTDNSFNKYENEYLFRTGIYKRIFKPLGLGANLIANNRISAAEIFTEYFGKYFLLKGSFAIDTKKDYSYTLYSEITGLNKLPMYFTWTQSFLSENSLTKKYNYRPITSYSKFGSGNIRYYFGNSTNSIGFRGSYYKDYYNMENYSFGPEIEFNFSFGLGTTMTVRLNAYRTDRDYQALLNFYFNFNSKYLQLYNNSSYIMHKDRTEDKNFSDHFDTSAAITLQDGGIFNQDFRLTGRYDKIDGTQTFGGELDYRSPIGRLTANASTNKYIDQYNINFASIFAFSSNNILFGGREPKDSAIGIKIDGGNKKSVFDVLVNENKIGSIKGNSSKVFTLNPFNEYTISLQPSGLNNTYIENSRPRTITAYPGGIESIKYNAKSTAIIIGTLYNADGKIFKNAKIVGEIDDTISDDEGYFQITAVLGETLKINDEYEIKVPKKIEDSEENIVFMDMMVSK